MVSPNRPSASADYCARKALKVIKTYERVESSMRGERKEFAAVLAFFTKSYRILSQQYAGQKESVQAAETDEGAALTK